MDLYTPQQVAEILGVSRRSVYRWIKEGRLPALKFVSQVRVKESDLEAFINKSEVEETKRREKHVRDLAKRVRVITEELPGAGKDK